MESLLLATGFTGGLTLVFVIRWMAQRLFTPPAIQVHFSPKGGCTEETGKRLIGDTFNAAQ